MEGEEDPFELTRRLERAGTVDRSNVATVERSDDIVFVEPDLGAKILDLQKVKKRVKVRGYDLKDPPKPKKDAEKKALKRADKTADYRRNRENYRIFCPTCRGSGKCPGCRGKGRVKLFFKCKRCGGSGICSDCGKDTMIECPQCHELLSKYSDSCTKCGLQFTCEKCYSPLPAMATRCMKCKNEYICNYCGKPYPRSFSWKCPHCGRWNGEKNE